MSIYPLILIFILMSIPFWVSIFVFEEVRAVIEWLVFMMMFICITSLITHQPTQHNIATLVVKHLERKY